MLQNFHLRSPLPIFSAKKTHAKEASPSPMRINNETPKELEIPNNTITSNTMNSENTPLLQESPSKQSAITMPEDNGPVEGTPIKQALSKVEQDKIDQDRIIQENLKRLWSSTPSKPAAPKKTEVNELADNWKCCEWNEISQKSCDKRNVLEVTCCERCGHWQCEECTLTMDPDTPAKEYPKPKDPESGIVRRASISLKRAGSVLSRTTTNTKGKEVVKVKAIAEDDENEQSNENKKGVTLEDNGSTGTNLVRRASTTIKNAMKGKRRSTEPKIEEQVEKPLPPNQKIVNGALWKDIDVVKGCGRYIVPLDN